MLSRAVVALVALLVACTRTETPEERKARIARAADSIERADSLRAEEVMLSAERDLAAMRAKASQEAPREVGAGPLDRDAMRRGAAQQSAFFKEQQARVDQANASNREAIRNLGQPQIPVIDSAARAKFRPPDFSRAATDSMMRAQAEKYKRPRE